MSAEALSSLLLPSSERETFLVSLRPQLVQVASASSKEVRTSVLKVRYSMLLSYLHSRERGCSGN